MPVTAQGRRGQLHSPNTYVAARGFARGCPALSGGIHTPASSHNTRACIMRNAGHEWGPQPFSAESAGHPRQEALSAASSYLLWDLELLHHAELVVHLNATLHKL